MASFEGDGKATVLVRNADTGSDSCTQLVFTCFLAEELCIFCTWFMSLYEHPVKFGNRSARETEKVPRDVSAMRFESVSVVLPILLTATSNGVSIRSIHILLFARGVSVSMKNNHLLYYLSWTPEIHHEAS